MAARFAILHHRTGGGEHWDLLIAMPGARLDHPEERGLATWQLSIDPFTAGSAAVPAARIADHRNLYLNYEGPISGGRGEVRRLDRGDCEILEQAEKVWRIRLEGERMRGHFALTLAEPGFWSLTPSIVEGTTR